jgi:hypothetical protein
MERAANTASTAVAIASVCPWWKYRRAKSLWYS